MPPQHVEIAETLAAVKRALKREREAPTPQPIAAASNRGNKLEPGAKYVHEGALAFMNGSDVYKQKIEHAGYTRYILARNPHRYNQFGDELDDSESDQEADGDAEEQNPYGGIRLEELLCPLKHPSELPIHPTMSHAYLSSALPDMVKTTQDKLRQERANLWRAKRLNRQFIGDESWMPCGAVESANDWELFEPRKKPVLANGYKKRKIKGHSLDPRGVNGADAVDHANATNGIIQVVTEQEAVEPSSALLTGHPDAADIAVSDLVRGKDSMHTGSADDKAEELRGTADDVHREPQDVQMNGTDDPATVPAIIHTSATNGVHNAGMNGIQNEGQLHAGPERAADSGNETHKDESNGTERVHSPKSPSDADEATPPPPPRRITRALAANHNSNSHSNTPTPALSPTPTLSSASSSSLQIDPLFLLPSSVHSLSHSSALYGLPSEEATETRRLLTTYIQKQEESVRGYEAVLAKLLKAQRLKDEVLEMCKAEGHIGEMSDGEDWIDHEAWGLQPGDLKKGRDEDEDAVEENTIGGRKGKRRGRN